MIKLKIISFVKISWKSENLGLHTAARPSKWWSIQCTFSKPLASIWNQRSTVDWMDFLIAHNLNLYLYWIYSEIYVWYKKTSEQKEVLHFYNQPQFIITHGISKRSVESAYKHRHCTLLSADFKVDDSYRIKIRTIKCVESGGSPYLKSKRKYLNRINYCYDCTIENSCK